MECSVSPLLVIFSLVLPTFSGFESVLLLLFGAFLFQDLLCQSSEDEFVTAKVASFISHKTVLQFSQDRNGYNLSTPKTEKFSKDCENGCVRYGLSSMQGWRATMEDAVSALNFSLPI
ncbi:hypothetical protein FF1_028938 [Malus domestica]